MPVCQAVTSPGFTSVAGGSALHTPLTLSFSGVSVMITAFSIMVELCSMASLFHSSMPIPTVTLFLFCPSDVYRILWSHSLDCPMLSLGFAIFEGKYIHISYSCIYSNTNTTHSSIGNGFFASTYQRNEMCGVFEAIHFLLLRTNLHIFSIRVIS